MSVVAAVVPSFRPDPSTVHPLISTLVVSGVPVLVADDASACTYDPVLRETSTLGARLVRHRRNAGIARSLNDGLRFARSMGSAWLLTIDQDSELPDGYVARLVDAMEAAEATLGTGRVGAVAAGSITDASGDIDYQISHVAGVPTTPEVMQTGTLWNVLGLERIGGFDEEFGIDAVDAAACVRLRANGAHIVVAPGVTVGHRLGEARQVRLLGRTVLATGHSPDRRATIVRNRLRLAPEEFRQSPAYALRTLRRVAVGMALAVTVEDDRWAKAKGSIRGLLHRRDG